MNAEIIKKLDEHDGQLEIIARTVLGHTEKLGEHGRILGEHSRILGEHSKTLDRHTRILEDHTERLDRIEQKMDGLATKNDHQQILNAIDNLVKLSEKRDHETVALTYNLRIVDDKVEKHEKDISQIKTTLGLGQIVSG